MMAMVLQSTEDIAIYTTMSFLLPTVDSNKQSNVMIGMLTTEDSNMHNDV